MATKRRINSCLVILPCLLLSCFFWFSVSRAADTLRAGEVMRDWEYLESSGRMFQLKFFVAYSSSNHYLGIVPGNFYDINAAWVGNRENPLVDTSGVLNMTQDGKLVITDSRGTYVTIYSHQPATSSSTSATILDSGNLVIREGERIVWQSFDYPSDTWLQGMKLGRFDLKMERPYNRSLTSWLSPQVAAQGAFTLDVDPNNAKQLVIWRRGVLYWRSGIWNGFTFSNLVGLVYPFDLGHLNEFNFSYFSNENESYFTFTVINNTGGWIKMASLGQIEIRLTQNDSVWLETDWSPCDDYDYGTLLKGCVTREPSGCRGGDMFSPPSGQAIGEFDLFLKNSSWVPSDCKEMCLRNCSCTAYAYSYSWSWSNGTGCVFAHGQNKTFKYQAAGTLHIRTIGEKDRRREKKRQLLLAVGASVVSLIILIVVFILCYFRWIRRFFGGKNGSNQDGINEDTELLLYNEGNSIAALNELSGAHKLDLSGKKVHELPLFKFSSIEIATDHFSDANKIGEGGFGAVYKGKLAQGQKIAVKRLSKNSQQGLKEFKNEVVLISKLQHRNLVRLLGCCIQGEERILIYEYLPNNSLDSFLFDATRQALLDWNKRVRIIEGIAQGLLYLHKYSRLKIIHRDLKTSNILLDGDMNPKISDFGTARIFGENESQASTNRIVGTYGYMSPEYALNGLFSVKSDVFSFGVMMLEIISGKKSKGYYQSNCSSNLLGYAWDLYKEGRCLELVDPALEESYSRNEVLRYVQIGLLCVQESAVDRPTMSDVVSMLSNESMTLPVPKQPDFSSIAGANDAALLENLRPLACSLNDVTITEMEAR